MADRSSLLRKLSDLMPKVAGMSPDYTASITPQFKVDHIRYAADSFVNLLNGDLPTDRRELGAMLYVFGQILDGQLQRRLHHAERLFQDALNTTLMPATLINDRDAPK